MADITSPAALSYSGGTLRTSRVAPARLRYSGGTVSGSIETPLTTPATIPSLNRLTQWDRPEGWPEESWQRFMAIWQEMCGAAEDAFVAVNARVDEVALYARLNRVEQLAAAANDNASAAQTSVTQVQAAVSQTFAEIDPIYETSFNGRVEP